MGLGVNENQALCVDKLKFSVFRLVGSLLLRMERETQAFKICQMFGLLFCSITILLYHVTSECRIGSWQGSRSVNVGRVAALSMQAKVTVWEIEGRKCGNL